MTDTILRLVSQAKVDALNAGCIFAWSQAWHAPSPKTFAFTSMLGRWIAGLALLGSCVLLQGCATVQEPFHQLDYCNVGSVTLTFVKIQYGTVVWPMTAEKTYRGGGAKCLGSSSISDTMPIPAMMQITWRTEDGQEHKASVPVRSKLSSRYPINTIQVRFNNDQVEVVERVYATPAQRLDFPIYP